MANLAQLRFVWSALAAPLFALLVALPLRADTNIPPAPTRWVTDTASMLSDAARSRLDAKLEQYDRTTGHQIVVWIGQTIGAAPLDDFAVKTFEAWRIGRKGHDDGVLMIVLARDRKIDIEVGYGLEERLTDAAAHRIIEEVMAPRLRENKPDEALAAGVDAVLGTIEGRAVTDQPTTNAPRDVPMSPLGWVVLIALGALLALLFATNPALATYFLFSIFSGGGGFGGGGGGGSPGFGGGGGRSGGGGARGGW